MISFFLIWNLYFFVAAHTGIIWLSMVLMLGAILATCYGSFVLCQHRDEVVFTNLFARAHAFPSNPNIASATFNMHLVCFLLFFLVPALSAPLSYSNPDLHENLALSYVGFLIGLAGVVGLVHYFMRKVVDRMTAAVK